MKAVLIAATLFASLSSFALDSLPNDHWAGTGRYTMASGQKGTYREDLTVKNNVMTSTMDYGGQKSVYVLTHKFSGNGIFTVSINDKSHKRTMNGSGYCGSVWCHVQSDDRSFEMTYAFVNGHALELGSYTDATHGFGYFESALNPIN